MNTTRAIRHAATLLAIITITFTTTVMAQKEEPRTLEQLIPGGKKYIPLEGKSLPQLQFAGDKYLYTKEKAIIAGTPLKKGRETIITLDELNTLLGDTLKKIPQYTAAAEDGTITLQIKNGSKIYHIDTSDKTVIRSYTLESGDGTPIYNPATHRYAVSRGNTIILLTPDGKRKTAVSTDQPETKLGSNDVHRNEFGIKQGIFWSNSGRYIAYYQMDERPVKDYPLVNTDTREATLRTIKYPMAGMKSHKVKIGIYDTRNGKSRYLKTGTPDDKYLTNITWSPDDTRLYTIEINRSQDTSRMVSYTTNNGKPEKEILKETSEKYTEPEHAPLFINNDTFIYLTRADGYRHAYLYNTDGKQLRQLTKGAWEILEAELSPDRRTLYITAAAPTPTEENLYRVNISDGTTERITSAPGVHTTQISQSGKYYIDRYSNHDTPLTIKTGDIQNGTVETLHTAKAAYPINGRARVSSGTIKSADGTTDLYYRLTTPADTTNGQRYPVIIYVYGGPHVQQVKESYLWGVRGWDLYMAERGYAVFTLDNRGSDNRGMEFESVTRLRLGQEELADQMQGVAYLKTLPYIDSTRIGVHGWSFGGFMTLNMTLNRPETFKVAVAGGAVTDWKYYEIMYGERYMSTPQKNPEGYRQSNMNLLSGNLKGKLLLIHCDNDPVVVWQHTLQYLKSSIKNGAYPDYFVYPGHQHNVVGHDRVHLYQKITDYFIDNL